MLYYLYYEGDIRCRSFQPRTWPMNVVRPGLSVIDLIRLWLLEFCGCADVRGFTILVTYNHGLRTRVATLSSYGLFPSTTRDVFIMVTQVLRSYGLESMRASVYTGSQKYRDKDIWQTWIKTKLWSNLYRIPRLCSSLPVTVLTFRWVPSISSPSYSPSLLPDRELGAHSKYRWHG